MNAHAPVSCRNAVRRPFVQFERTGEFDGYGSLTVRGLVHDLCRHDRQHLAGMQWLLGKIDAALCAWSARTASISVAPTPAGFDLNA